MNHAVENHVQQTIDTGFNLGILSLRHLEILTHSALFSVCKLFFCYCLLLYSSLWGGGGGGGGTTVKGVL